MSEDQRADVPMQRLGGYLGTFLKSCLSVFPVTTWLVPVLDDAVSRSSERAIRQAFEELSIIVEDLGDRIETVQERIDEDALADAFKSFVRHAQQTSRREKLRAAANLMANALLKDGDPDKLAYEAHDHFARCLDDLSVGALYVLTAAVKFVKERAVPGSDVGEHRLLSGDLIPAVDGLAPDLAMSLVSELSARNLLRVSDSPATVTFSTRDPDAYRSNVILYLTSIGKRFAKSLLDTSS